MLKVVSVRMAVLVKPEDLIDLLRDFDSTHILAYYASGDWEDFCESFDLDPQMELITSHELLVHIAKKHPVTPFREEMVDIISEYDLIFTSKERAKHNDFYGDWVDLFDAYDRIMQYAESHIEDILNGDV